jgi:ABC-type Fe3+-hydroxamate transport system substrate-binding protein
MAGVADVGGFGGTTGVDFEKILSAQPDLIVSHSDLGAPQVTDVDRDRLRQIAPVVVMEIRHTESQSVPEDLVRPFLDLANLDPEVLAAQKREYLSVVDEIRTLLQPNPGALQFAMLLFVDQQNFQYQNPKYYVRGPMQVLADAGATWAPGGPQEFAERATRYSIERLHDLANVDILAIYDFRSAERDLRADPLVKLLPVSQSGQVITFKNAYGVGNYPELTECAREMLVQLQAMKQPLRSDIA